MPRYLILIFYFLFFQAPDIHSQDRIILTGKVVDSKTKEPLSFATVGVKMRPDQATTNDKGDFFLSVPVQYFNDSLTVTYIGYKDFIMKISTMQSPEMIPLDESFTLLKEVVIAHRKLNLRDVDRSLRKIRGNIYAMDTEVTNGDFNYFLNDLDEYNRTEQHKKYNYDLSKYSGSEKEFFQRYSMGLDVKAGDKDSAKVDRREYPAVNVSHEAALAYCNWLTEKYNSNTKRKKFPKVKFRLPTIKEWQIAALGYERFQSWELYENVVEVIIPKNDTLIEIDKGKRKKLQVSETDILYPWYGAYNYRNKPHNHFYCFLGNFKITSVSKSCITNFYGYDGYTMMGRCGSYFPNNIGFYDMVGNVAEMIDEKGKACGGSWSDPPLESTIHSVKNYSRPDASIGFRVFMEVLDDGRK